MDFDKYEYNLRDQLNLKIDEYLSELGFITVRNYPIEIARIEKVYASAQIDDFKPHTLLSGTIIEARVEGSVRLFEKQEYGSRSRTVEFWFEKARFKFNLEKESFEILNLGSFIPIDFVR